MITNLREAKSNLSQLVRRAAAGEEIVITVRGRPTARLTCVLPDPSRQVSRRDWVDELARAAEAVSVGPQATTPQQIWDELRADRT